MAPFDTLSPMLLDAARHRPFSHPDWVFEVKFDGYRMLAEFGDGHARLKTRGGHDCTDWFPEVARALKAVPGRHVVDGEVCVLDELGRSDFERLHARALRRGHYPGCDAVTFCVFDLLAHDGRDVTAEPLLDRKARLAALFTPQPGRVLVVTSIAAEGEQLYQMACQLKLEGLTAKLASSQYLPGERSRHWRKLKRPGVHAAGAFRRA